VLSGCGPFHSPKVPGHARCVTAVHVARGCRDSDVLRHREHGRLTASRYRTYLRVMVTHADEAHCRRGAVWRVYADEKTMTTRWVRACRAVPTLTTCVTSASGGPAMADRRVSRSRAGARTHGQGARAAFAGRFWRRSNRGQRIGEVPGLEAPRSHSPPELNVQSGFFLAGLWRWRGWEGFTDEEPGRARLVPRPSGSSRPSELTSWGC
jgi:hypothetical protein